MLIGELSRRSGLSRDTIRFYEKEGLITARNPGRKEHLTNSYKDYPEIAVSALRFIQRTKVLGFTLSEIKDMLSVRVQHRPSRKWAAKAEAKLLVIEEKIAELVEVKRLLSDALARCSDQCFDLGCGMLDDAIAKKTMSASRPVPREPSHDYGDCSPG